MRLVDLLQDRGVPLPADLRRTMEAGFGRDFSDVRVHVSDAASSLNRRLGSRACTDGRSIAFAHGAFRPGTTQGRWLIAHELAHVVQKRAARPDERPRCSVIYEREADAAASAVLGNGQPVSLSPDPSQEIRLWGEPGHYYTVYYCSLAAGLPNALAYQLAFLSQLPDEVEELDAIELAFKYRSEAAAYRGAHQRIRSQGGYNPYGPSGIRGSHIAVEQDRLNFSLQEMNKALRIQAGLHCLNGRVPSEETERVKGILFKHSITTLEFGLALHAFGDSYSHRDPKTGQMYVGPLGHFHAEPHHKPGPQDRPIEIAKGCGVDYLHLRKTDYVIYGLDLCGLLRRAYNGDILRRDSNPISYGTQRKRGADKTAADVSADLNAIASKGSATEQIQLMRQLSEEMESPMVPYAPERHEAITWNAFKSEHDHPIIGGIVDLKVLEGIAVSWAEGISETNPLAAHGKFVDRALPGVKAIAKEWALERAAEIGNAQAEAAKYGYGP